MTSDEVRVRIAPSPTGYFHVGTARTAIYNWLYARKHGGKFLLRIEDTDQERSRKEYIDIILDGLNWMGLNWDEDIVYQSEHIQTYADFAEKLLDEGKAYKCFITPDELEQERQKALAEKRQFVYFRKYRDATQEEIDNLSKEGNPFTIRLRLPIGGEATIDDVVYGKVHRSYEDLGDPIILRSDRTPVYNFAVVCDDHNMGISHVIRGNDHITNTFYQAEIYRALGWDLPKFAHLPLILRPDKSKVSKRKGDKGVTDYQKEGYLPQAFVNYLALIGWSPKDDREKMELEEMVDAFSLDGINPNNAIFDIEKLTWMNGEYIRDTDANELIEYVRPYLIDEGITTKYWIETNWHWTVKVLEALKPRCKLLPEFAEQIGYFFSDDFEYQPKGVRKHFAKGNTAELLRELTGRYENIKKWDKETLEKELREVADKKDVKPANVIHPTRLAVSGTTAGPGLFEILELVGRDRVLKRLDGAIEYIEAGEFPEPEGN